MNDDGNLIVEIDMQVFLDSLSMNPFVNAPWINCFIPLTVDEVMNAPHRKTHMSGEISYPRREHLARVKYLVDTWVNDGEDAPDVEVYQGVYVHDGWHRIAAAIVRTDTSIFVALGGFMDEAREYGYI